MNKLQEITLDRKEKETRKLSKINSQNRNKLTRLHKQLKDIRNQKIATVSDEMQCTVCFDEKKCIVSEFRHYLYEGILCSKLDLLGA